MATRRVTIVDLARHLGLSKTTVSDALHGGGRVSPSTTARVAIAAQELGYVTNRAARQLRGRSVGAFGLYIPPVARNFQFYMEFAFGAAHEAAEHDSDLTLLAREPSVGPRQFQVDGVVVVDPLPGDVMLERISAAGVPLVTAGRPPKSVEADVLAVIEAPHGDIAQEVLNILRRSGFARPAFMHADEQFVSSAADDARLSYLEWCSMNGVKPHLCSVPLNVTTTQLREIVQSLIAPADVDALVCAPQGFAGRSLSILEESLGVHVGASFGLASLAGDPTTEIGNPHITVATLSAWNFGSQAVRLLAAAIGGNQTDREHRFDDFVIQKALID